MDFLCNNGTQYTSGFISLCVIGSSLQDSTSGDFDTQASEIQTTFTGAYLFETIGNFKVFELMIKDLEQP